jgi:hypothetical protein
MSDNTSNCPKCGYEHAQLVHDPQGRALFKCVRAVRRQFGIAQDGIERRAQLMAHIGEELRLVLAGLFKLPALVLDFF